MTVLIHTTKDDVERRFTLLIGKISGECFKHQYNTVRRLLTVLAQHHWRFDAAASTYDNDCSNNNIQRCSGRSIVGAASVATATRSSIESAQRAAESLALHLVLAKVLLANKSRLIIIIYRLRSAELLYFWQSNHGAATIARTLLPPHGYGTRL